MVINKLNRGFDIENDGMIPIILTKIKEYLKSRNYKTIEEFMDGRINSAINEKIVLSIIKSKYGNYMKVPKIRDWYDFAIEYEDQFYPVNIKITDTTHADNLNCKLGIYYVLCGKMPPFDNEVDWISYLKNLNKNIKENDKDYYFLVINKNNPKDIFVNGLKTLATLQPNGNNLPFQCKWNINRLPIERNFYEAKKFILSNFGASIKQRSEIYFIFKKFFGEYVE